MRVAAREAEAIGGTISSLDGLFVLVTLCGRRMDMVIEWRR